jgi:hypothetical protein
MVARPLRTWAHRVGDTGGVEPNLDRCAQLGAVAHGGQTVLSRSAQQLVAGRLPDGASLVDLGVHRLRDLGPAEHVFELAYPGLASGFPPLSSLGAWPNNLPEQFTSFVGRDDDLDDVGDSLARSRLVAAGRHGWLCRRRPKAPRVTGCPGRDSRRDSPAIGRSVYAAVSGSSLRATELMQ